MKFGEYLKEGKNPEWTHSYLDYDKLKTMISDLMEAHVGAAHDTGRGASLSVARPTNAAGMPLGAKEDHVTQEQFFSFIEQEIRKIDMFTKKQVFRGVLHTSAASFAHSTIITTARCIFLAVEPRS
jgi:SPX domain protein involved in polyphosphate accumulation